MWEWISTINACILSSQRVRKVLCAWQVENHYHESVNTVINIPEAGYPNTKGLSGTLVKEQPYD